MEFTETVKKILKHIDDLNIQRNTDKFSHIVKLIKGDKEPDEFEKPLIDEILKYARSDEYKGEDILGMFFNEFNYLQKKHDKGQVFTPKHIADLICKTMDITEEDSILDAACGTGILLTSTIPYKVRGLYGVEFTEDIAEMAAANMTIRSDVVAEVISGDTRSTEISDWIKSKAITKVLMNPPYENKFGCIPIVINVLKSVKPGTKCVFILPDKKFEKASKSQKKEIFEKNNLTKIVKLPKDTFYGVGVETSLFYFVAGEPQGETIWTTYIEESGLCPVKNRQPEDRKGLWRAKEDSLAEMINSQKEGVEIKSAEHLSYQMPEKPFEIYEEDFELAAFKYTLYKNKAKLPENTDEWLLLVNRLASLVDPERMEKVINNG